MRKLLSVVMLVAISCGTLFAQGKTQTIKNKLVEASCAQCQFKVKEPQGCDLSVRFQGKIYFVDGTNLDAHGDAHEADGFCNAIRQAKVSGTLEGNRIKVTQFDLRPSTKKKS